MTGLTALAVSAIALTSCHPRELEFEHEETQFDIKPNAILIELIAPVGTPTDEEIYIFGAFNGLDEDSVIGQVKWQMEKAPASDKKWGIYLFPEDFKDGVSLADGFSFASRRMGGERDINGKPVTHTLNASLGTSNNVSALRWAAYFQTGKIQHDGPVIYVLDETGFKKLCLYAYQGLSPLNGAWPGMVSRGKETVNGIELDYFDMGELNEGMEAMLIFNDNGNAATQLKDYGPVILGEDTLYLHLTKDGRVEPLRFDGKLNHDGPILYVLDGLDWGMNTRLHMWNAFGTPLFGEWPGMEVTGTEKIGRYTYLYFDLGAANEGLEETMILSDNGNDQTQLNAYGPITLTGEQYFYISGKTAKLIADPENPGDVEWFEPVILPKDSASVDLWIYDATNSLSSLYVYAWGDGEAFGAWPGKSFAEMDTTTVLGLRLFHTQINGFVGDNFHLIFNNNGPGEGQAGDWRVLYDISAEKRENVHYLKVANEGVSKLSVVANLPRKE